MIHKIDKNGRILPKLAILATGGTIAGRATRAGSVAEYESGEISAKDLLASVDGLGSIARIRCEQVANIGSENITDDVWLDLYKAARKELARDDVDGVVILHGTDTMEETAVFLDLTLGKGQGKPVVLTGAMRPADAPSADGPANILAAARVAACPASRDRGVLVAINDVVHRARRVAKKDTLALDAFHSVGGGEEGRLVDGRVMYYRAAPTGETAEKKSAGKKPAEAGDFIFRPDGKDGLPRVEIVYGHAGQDRGMIDAAIAAGAWGLVHAGVGLGNVHRDARAALAGAVAAGVAVVCASRVGGGVVPLTDAMRRDGFVSAGDLNAQKARVVLRLALTRHSEGREIQKTFDAYR